jgi:hypothetical protein
VNYSLLCEYVTVWAHIFFVICLGSRMPVGVFSHHRDYVHTTYILPNDPFSRIPKLRRAYVYPKRPTLCAMFSGVFISR